MVVGSGEVVGQIKAGHYRCWIGSDHDNNNVGDNALDIPTSYCRKRKINRKRKERQSTTRWDSQSWFLSKSIV